jgi:transposase
VILPLTDTKQQDAARVLQNKIEAMQKYFGGLIKRSEIIDLIGNNPETNQPFARSTIDRWIKNYNLFGESILHKEKGKKSLLTEEVKKEMTADIHLRNLEGNGFPTVNSFTQYFYEHIRLSMKERKVRVWKHCEINLEYRTILSHYRYYCR